MNQYDMQAYRKMRVDARQHIRDVFGVEQFDRQFVQMVKRVLV